MFVNNSTNNIIYDNKYYLICVKTYIYIYIYICIYVCVNNNNNNNNNNDSPIILGLTMILVNIR